MPIYLETTRAVLHANKTTGVNEVATLRKLGAPYFLDFRLVSYRDRLNRVRGYFEGPETPPETIAKLQAAILTANIRYPLNQG